MTEAAGESMTATSRLLAVYLAVTLVPLLAGGFDLSRILVAGGHLLLISLLLRRPVGRRHAPAWVDGPARRDVAESAPPTPANPAPPHLPADPASPTASEPTETSWGAFRPARHALRWLPLLLVPALYAELPLLNQALTDGFHDGLVLRWEALFFGGNPARSWAGAFPHPLVSELLHASYLSYYGLIYAPPLLLYARGRFGAFESTVFTLMLVFVICFLVFIVFPVQGPRYLYPAPPGIPEGPVRALVLAVLEAGSSRGAAFPSSHMAVAVAQSVLALRFQRPVGVAVALLTIGLGAGAVYGGFHYAVDIVAGGLIGGLAALLHPVAVRWIGGGGEALASSPSGA